MITDKEFPVQKAWLKKQAAVVVILAVVVIIGFFSDDTATGIGTTFFVSACILTAAAALLYQSLVRAHFHYQLDENFLTVREGVFNRAERHIPYGTLQDVLLSQDIIDRLVGISTLRLENAVQGGQEKSKRRSGALYFGMFQKLALIGSLPNGVIVPGLKKEHAENLRAALLQKVKDHPLAETGSGL